MLGRNDQFRSRVFEALHSRRLSAEELADRAGIDPKRLNAMLAKEGYLLWFEMEAVTRILDQGEHSEAD